MSDTDQRDDQNDPDELVGPHVPGVLEQAVDEDLIVYNPATENYFTLNRTARGVWELADGTRTGAAIAAVLADEYGVDAADVVDDVNEIIASFAEAGLI